MTATTAPAAPTARTREEWLTNAVFALASGVLADAGISVPKIRVSVGFPAHTRGGKGTHSIGQCWSKAAAADGVAQVFISPELSDSVRVMDVLLHEILHAIDDCQSGHRGNFRDMAIRVGLRGKMTATIAGAGLRAELNDLVEELGTYPHARHYGVSTGAKTSGPKTQGTRMIKLVSDDCGYTVRTTQKWIDEGMPSCPHGHQMHVA